MRSRAARLVCKLARWPSRQGRLQEQQEHQEEQEQEQEQQEQQEQVR